MANYPRTATVYELTRVHPGAVPRLRAIGLTPDQFGCSLKDAARDLHIPVHRLAQIIAEDGDAPAPT